MKKRLQFLLGFSFVAVAYLYVHHHFDAVAKSDPDRYFHLALARQGAQEGIVRKVPQVEDLGWGEKFLEKNFLFTWITGRAYALGGEIATLQVVPITGLFFLAVLFFLCTRFASCFFSTWILLLLFLSPDMANRLSLLRPHLFAFLTFALTFSGILVRLPLLSFLGSFLFSLSYHANYLILVLILFGLPFLKEAKGPWLKSLLGASVGLVLGLIANPFFPQNVFAGANSFKIALNLEQFGPEDRPFEVIPIETREFLSLFGPYILLLVATLYFAYRKNSKARHSVEFYYSLFVTVFFWFLSLVSRRGIEYAIPSTIVFLAINYRDLGEGIRWPRYAWLGIPLLFLWPKNLVFYRSPLVAGISEKQTMEAISTLPVNISGKVFNCDWDNGSFLLYQRPNFHFVDLSDAILLKNARPDLHDARIRLRRGFVAFPYGLIAHIFKAQYVVCDHREIVAQLERDPLFIKLSGNNGPTHVYQLLSPDRVPFVSHYERLVDKEWKLVDMRPSPILPPSLFVAIQKESSVSCAEVRPVDLKPFYGSTLLGVGGGDGIEVFRKGNPLAKLRSPMKGPRLVHSFIPLDPPLRPKDELKIRLCSDGPIWGTATSFWTRKSLEAFCHQKNPGTPTRESSPWAIAPNEQETCLGKILLPSKALKYL